AQVAAAGRGNQVLATPDGRVVVRFGADGNVSVAMGPTDEGKVHHVVLKQHLGGGVIATYDSIGAAPGAPLQEVASEVVDEGADRSASTGRPAVVARQPALEDGSVIHVVRPGQTLLAIALAYDIGLRALMEDNNLTDSLLLVGQELSIRAAPEEQPEQPDHCAFYGPVVYVVRPGDSLYGIARVFDVQRELLYIRNQLPDGGRLLWVGQELIIPGVTRPETRGREVPAECVDDSPILHLVQADHTLDAIARAYDLAPEIIVERNDLPAGSNQLRAGRTLVIRDPARVNQVDPENRDAPAPNAG
ncbi:MAG: LysM peptidoglycan-binding domain-containing protein, partial [Anaerolineaceae bacterium]|nr:LysM peptidoglycan-binding domain-containing protein [Anaerolineaceae bacterium]